MPNTMLAEAPATVRCCAAWHVGTRTLPASAFYASQAKKRYGSYCKECYCEWKRAREAKRRGEVAADVGPDYTVIAEAQLYPGQAYADLTAAERWAAIEHAKALATAAGVYPPAPVAADQLHVQAA